MLRKNRTRHSPVSSAITVDLSRSLLQRIIEISHEQTIEALNRPLVYPHPSDFRHLTHSDIVELGFDWKHKARGKRRKGSDRSRVLPDPKLVAAGVSRLTGSTRLASNKGRLILGEWNMEFLDQTKAKYFLESYQIIIPRHHLIFCSEVSEAGLSVIAKAVGYNHFCSRANNRNQAVGFLVHPRLEVKGQPISYESVARVGGVPDLRPAFQLNLRDTSNECDDSSDEKQTDEFAGIVVHAKSMRGGEAKTSPIRRKQNELLADELVDVERVIVSGDFNTKIGQSTDLEPLLKKGFRLLRPRDKTPTQRMGSRIDGFLFRGTEELVDQKITSWWNETDTVGLSDHGTLSCRKRQKQAKDDQPDTA